MIGSYQPGTTRTLFNADGLGANPLQAAWDRMFRPSKAQESDSRQVQRVVAAEAGSTVAQLQIQAAREEQTRRVLKVAGWTVAGLLGVGLLALIRRRRRRT